MTWQKRERSLGNLGARRPKLQEDCAVHGDARFHDEQETLQARAEDRRLRITFTRVHKGRGGVGEPAEGE